MPTSLPAFNVPPRSALRRWMIPTPIATIALTRRIYDSGRCARVGRSVCGRSADGGRLKRRTDPGRDGGMLRRVAHEYGSRGAAGPCSDAHHVFRNHFGWLYDGGLLTGYFNETETDELSNDGNSYTGTNELKMYDLSGNITADLTGTASATRLAP